MQKIPSVFRRDPDDMAHLLPEVHPDAQWVLDGEGVPTRKYDGTCVMLDEQGAWWARREVKPGKTPPPNWRKVDVDDHTGKAMGWEPIEQSGYAKAFAEAVTFPPVIKFQQEGTSYAPGTYELCGPKVNGNPEGYDHHVLASHALADRTVRTGLYVRDLSSEEAFDSLREQVMRVHESFGWEGLVWHHPDGRMAKLKARDFR